MLSPELPAASRFVSLTPTRNESWIIKHFISAAKHWADDIIVADQGSTDGTLEELKSTPGVNVVINDSVTYDEVRRQRLLIDRARTLPGKRILIALDADEALSSNCVASTEWDKIRDAAPGTILRFKWVNILPGFDKVWIPPNLIPCGFVDDGHEHVGSTIHSTRIPTPPNAPVLDLHEIVVLHFQYVIWSRVVSKHCWYQAWEHLSHPNRSPLAIFRQYNHMYGGWNPDEIYPLDPAWLGGYDRAHLDYRTLKAEPVTWWDREVLQMMRDRGARHFSRIALWSRDWSMIAEHLGLNGTDVRDPRSWFERLAHRILAASQSHRANWAVRAFERLLRARGW